MKNLGLAKAKFQASYNRSPWNNTLSFSRHTPNWQFLEAQFTAQRISYFDYLLTQRLLRSCPEKDENVAFFLCHLILAAKAGHLYIHVCSSEIFPLVAQLWNGEGSQELCPAEQELIAEYIHAGANLLPTFLVTSTVSCHLTDTPSTPLCQNEQAYYLQKYWVFESFFLHYLSEHLKTAPTITLDCEKIDRELEIMQKSGLLNFEQAYAIKQSCQYPLTLITGGPGTGKSYTAGKLLTLLGKNLKDSTAAELQIVLTAPTGKAVANLQKSLDNEALTIFPNLQAKTLHALLGIQRSNIQSTINLNADLILVDECSMVDIQMMYRLFAALKKGSRVILLGDPEQLPSIGAGSVFVDLNLQECDKLPFARAHLKNCLRAELKSIIEFAECVKEGNPLQVIEKLNQAQTGVSRLTLNSQSSLAQKELVKYFTHFFSKFSYTNLSENEIFSSFNTLRLLSPMRKGAFGVDHLNQLIWQSLSEIATQAEWLAIPIMISSNDYKQELYNGDTGVLFRKLPLNQNEQYDYALFASRTSSQELRRFSLYALPTYELAYCLSVHKSQGSEFEHVILVLPEGSDTFGREIFYTAITRARKKIEIWGTDTIIKKIISNKKCRLSNISDRFKQLNALSNL